MRRIFRPVPLLLLAAAAVVVLFYNLWSFCCGRCRLEHFLTLGPPGRILLTATAAAAAILLVLRQQRRRREERGRCRCGTLLAAAWHYCPACGAPAVPPR